MDNQTITIIMASVIVALLFVAALHDYLMRKHREHHGIEEPEECCCQRERRRRERERAKKARADADQWRDDARRSYEMDD